MPSLLLGDYNDLEVARETSVGLYLTSDDGDLLLPNKYVPHDARVGDVLRVFVYRDSEDRLIATTLEPFATVDSFAALSVRDHGPAGAFLDWGLEKELLLPFRNQRRDLRTGDRGCWCTCTSMRKATASWPRPSGSSFCAMSPSWASPATNCACSWPTKPTWATPSS